MTTIHTASFYRPDDWAGSRFRVSRQHPRGRKTQWETLPFFYPQRPLLSSYRGGEISFEAFRDLYWASLEAGYDVDPKMRHWVEAELPTLDEVTLLCFEGPATPCHRRVLARWIAEKNPGATLGTLS